MHHWLLFTDVFAPWPSSSLSSHWLHAWLSLSPHPLSRWYSLLSVVFPSPFSQLFHCLDSVLYCLTHDRWCRCSTFTSLHGLLFHWSSFAYDWSYDHWSLLRHCFTGSVHPIVLTSSWCLSWPDRFTYLSFWIRSFASYYAFIWDLTAIVTDLLFESHRLIHCLTLRIFDMNSTYIGRLLFTS
jgi:hypothetical protein